MHIHLDPVGGIAGDMFVAALLDAFPALTEHVADAIRLSGLDPSVKATVSDFTDGVLTGKRFDVSKGSADPPLDRMCMIITDRTTITTGTITSMPTVMMLTIKSIMTTATTMVNTTTMDTTITTTRIGRT